MPNAYLLADYFFSMYSLANGAKWGLVSGELSMMTETNFQKELRRVAGKYEGRLQKELSDGKGWS